MTVAERVAELEKRVSALEASPPPPETRGDFWILEGLRKRNPEHGAIAFAGTVPTPHGDVAWQWARLGDETLARDWAPASAALDALSHPVRLGLLQRIISGVDTTAELADDDALGTSGQLHHHLRALVAAGWLTSVARGRWAVPPAKVIPLLVILTAALD